jgi:tellurite resistance protein
MSGLAYALRSATRLWGLPHVISESWLLLTFVAWCYLVTTYSIQYARHPDVVKDQFDDPVGGSMGSLIGVATLVLVPGIQPYNRASACLLAVLGIAWHLGFSLWHGAKLWRGSRHADNTTPALYLPEVAGNFTSAAALGVLGEPDWAWLFLGAGTFSWLAIEAVVRESILYRASLPLSLRPLMGVQAAPAAVCAASLLLVDPTLTGQWTAMLLLGLHVRDDLVVELLPEAGFGGQHRSAFARRAAHDWHNGLCHLPLCT